MNKGEISFLFGERLKNLRKEHKLSHDKVVKKFQEKYNLKIGRDSLIAYEISDESRTKASKHPNMGMRVEYLYYLADFYGVSTDYLLGKTEIPTQNYTARKISEITGISIEVVEFFISQKAYYEKTGDDLAGSFNKFFSVENLESILQTIFLMRMALALGEAVSTNARRELMKLKSDTTSESWKAAMEWRGKLEDTKKEIRYARFESIDSYTAALDAVRNSSSILKEIDSLIADCINIIDAAENDMDYTEEDFED